MNLQAEARMNPTCKVQYAMLLYPLFCGSPETYVTISLLRASKQNYSPSAHLTDGNKFIGATKSNRHLTKQMHLDIHLFRRGDDSLWRTHLTLGLCTPLKGSKSYTSQSPRSITARRSSMSI